MWSNNMAGVCLILTNTLSQPLLTPAVRTGGEEAHRAQPMHGCKIRSRPQPSGALPCLLVLSQHDTKLGPFSGRATNQADRAKRPLGAGLPGLCWRMGQRGELQLPSHHSQAERARGRGSAYGEGQQLSPGPRDVPERGWKSRG